MKCLLIIVLSLMSALTVKGQSFSNELEKAIEGNPLSMNYIGRCYFNGDGVEQDYIKAFKWHYKAAVLGVPNSQYLIGVMYAHGTGVEKNEDESFKWFQKGALNNDENCCFMIGQYYIKKEKPDYEKGYYYLNKSDSLGCVEPSYLLANLYMNGIYVKKNDSTAYKYLKKASLYPNHFQSSALYNLGVCYEQGLLGITKNDSLKIIYFLKSARMGNKYAQSALADCYNLGNGVKKDIEYAKYWYKQSANQGYAEANYKLGKCYLEQGDTLIAIKQWGNEIGLNNAQSLYELAQYYFYSTDNQQESVKYYKRSADLNYAPAQYVISLFYLDGFYVEKNAEKGIDYLLKSAEKGYGEAKKLLEELYQEIDNETDSK